MKTILNSNKMVKSWIRNTLIKCVFFKLLKIYINVFLNIYILFYRPYWRCYYSNTDAVVYVIDSVDRERMGIAKDELMYMLKVS